MITMVTRMRSERSTREEKKSPPWNYKKVRSNCDICHSLAKIPSIMWRERTESHRAGV